MSKLITTARPKLTEPLETVTAFFAAFLLLTVALGTVLMDAEIKATV